METKYILCFSGGKDSTAMLIHLIENNKPIDDILYVNVGNWIWKSAQSHIKQVEETFNINITQLNVSDELKKGFEKWGFPSFFNRWCTGIKKETMRKFIREKYYDNYHIVQYIGYCSDEGKRTNTKLYHSYDGEYPLIEAGITTDESLNICKEYGFDFGGVYEHHSHFNCWLCPLQLKKELEWVYNNCPEGWEMLRKMQHNCYGYYQNKRTIFDFEKEFWENNSEKLKEKQMYARQKWNKRGRYYKR